MESLLIFVGIIALIYILSWIGELIRKSREYDHYAAQIQQLDESWSTFHLKAAKHEIEQKRRNELLDARAAGISAMAKEKAVGFPWLASAYADYFHLEDMKEASLLKTKKRPAPKAAAKVKEIAAKRRVAERKARLLKYQIAYYESLFPWLADLKSEDVSDELIRIEAQGVDEATDTDPASKWLTPEEYKQLSAREKYQIALDRYWRRKKTKWEIGRDYERYIGWRYESKGFSVRYQGIIKGFDDLGRDLVVSRGDNVMVVQCKYWSREKTIHEKHVFQLYGTMTAMRIDDPSRVIKGHFVTSTKLSERAKMFAEHLGIEISEGLPLKPYPCIKCNVSRRDNERIYHLPFDQQYDSTVIEPERGEFFAATVAEAEEKGFRRAFRYRGGESASS